MVDYDKANAALNKTKGQLFFKKGSAFLGSLLCRMDFEWDEKIPTAATNGLKLFWNPEFFLSLDEETRVTVLAHELWHVAYLHCIRGLNKEPDRYNIAADHVINLMLQSHGYYMKGFPYCMDPKFTGMSTEQVYDLLPPSPPSGGGGGSMPAGLGSDILPQNSNDPAQQTANTANAIAKVVGAITAAQMSKEAGMIPGEITMTVEHFLNPKLPWETILFNFFNDMVDMERSYARPNRRYDDPILPGEAGLTGLEHLIYYLDISGSVSDHDILRFNSEVKYIHSELRPQRLTLVTFDTKIQDVYEFTADDVFEKIVVTGRGGTDLRPVMAHAKLHKPNAMIIFTDLYVDIPAELPPCPLVWICLDNSRAEVPYGKLIHMDSKGNVKDGVTAPQNFTTGNGIYGGLNI